MTRLRSAMAVAIGACAIGATITPLAQAQTLPGGSTVPPIEPIGVPVPAGSTAAQLPVLPFPLFWQEFASPPPSPASPRRPAPSPDRPANSPSVQKMHAERAEK